MHGATFIYVTIALWGYINRARVRLRLQRQFQHVERLAGAVALLLARGVMLRAGLRLRRRPRRLRASVLTPCSCR